jgi:ATP-binding protein involved in chromosome partitioning
MSGKGGPTEEQVLNALRNVQDPELHRDIVSLGFVKEVAVKRGRVQVRVELTTPACPMKDRIRGDIERAIRELVDVRDVEIEFSARVRGAGTGSANLSGVRNIIVVGSGKGGVGKSTLSVLAAVGLARSGARVGLLDADVYGPSIPQMLGVEDVRPGMEGDRILPIETGGLGVMSIGFLVPPGQAIIWRGPMVHNMITQFLEQVDWGERDYLIVDLPPGTGDVPLTLSQAISATGAVIVCTPQEVALADAKRAMGMYRQLGVDILGLVENMSTFIAPDTGREYDLFGKGGAKRAADELKVPFLGSVPINVAVRVSGDRGTPATVFKDDPQGVGRAVMEVVESLAAQVSMRNLRASVDPEASGN